MELYRRQWYKDGHKYTIYDDNTSILCKYPAIAPKLSSLCKLKAPVPSLSNKNLPLARLMAIVQKYSNSQPSPKNRDYSQSCNSTHTTKAHKILHGQQRRNPLGRLPFHPPRKAIPVPSLRCAPPIGQPAAHDTTRFPCETWTSQYQNALAGVLR